jgi:hypothetical protein
MLRIDFGANVPPPLPHPPNGFRVGRLHVSSKCVSPPDPVSILTTKVSLHVVRSVSRSRDDTIFTGKSMCAGFTLTFRSPERKRKNGPRFVKKFRVNRSNSLIYSYTKYIHRPKKKKKIGLVMTTDLNPESGATVCIGVDVDRGHLREVQHAWAFVHKPFTGRLRTRFIVHCCCRLQWKKIKNSNPEGDVKSRLAVHGENCERIEKNEFLFARYTHNRRSIFVP